MFLVTNIPALEMGTLVKDFILRGGREYSQVELDTPLIAQEHYCVSFYVNLSNSSNTACNNLGMYFSDSHIYVPNLQYLNFTPQINDTTIVTDTLNWTLISGQYIAHGGERYIIIGNFYSDAQTNTINTSIGNSGPAYYYMDDVDVHRCYQAGIVEENDSKEDISIYPNPANDKITIEVKSTKIQSLQIVNVLGQPVINSKGLTANDKYTIDIGSLPKGIYFIQLQTATQSINKKFVKE